MYIMLQDVINMSREDLSRMTCEELQPFLRSKFNFGDEVITRFKG